MNFDFLREYLDTQMGTPFSETYVMQDHEVIFHHLAGLDDPHEGRRVKANGFYHIFSCTKVLTAAAGMQLWERGKFLMHDPVSDFLPEYADVRVKDATTGELRTPTRTMTVGDLFGMTSGLRYQLTWPELEELRASGKTLTTQNICRSLATEPLSFDPGTRFQYSLSHDVLAAVIEVIAGCTFGEYLKKNILLPLGMNETGFSIPAGCESRAVSAWLRDEKTGEYTPRGFTCGYQLGGEYESGGAGIITTPGDYRLLADALACGGKGATGARILSPATIDMMRTPRNDLPFFDYLMAAGYRYGYGVRTMADPSLGNSPIGEFGWDGACGCFILSDPKNRLSMFHARYVSSPMNNYHSPRLRNILYACMD